MFENPPFRDQSQKNNKEDTKRSIHTDKSYVRNCMSSEKKYGSAANDILNCFVYSAWKYYIRNDADSYIIFALIKHRKGAGISNRKFNKGFIFNRRYLRFFGGYFVHMVWLRKCDETIFIDVFEIVGAEKSNW